MSVRHLLSSAPRVLLTAGAVVALGASAPAFAAPTAPASSSVALAEANCNAGNQNDPRSCADAAQWALNHVGQSQGTGTCDHVVAVAYGFGNSGSATAIAHWRAVPGQYKYAGDRSVPKGGLAFFSGGSQGYGHVMISVGGGDFVSTDVGSNGRYAQGGYNHTSIALIESSFGESYLGWTQPWFQVNH